ncbi:unnamed protein product [Rhodiola kirilowii]
MGSKKKNKNKSKTQTPKETPEALWPTTFRISARNMSSGELSGVIFGCKHSTIQECFDKQLFGLPSLHFVYIRHIKPGLPLFLFNYSDRRLHGIFEAKCAGQMNIDRYAWSSESEDTTPFPAQVRFQIKTRCQPLSEDQFKPLISTNYFEEKYFWNELDSVQTKNLIGLFISLARTPTAPTKSNSTVKKLNNNESKQESNGNATVSRVLKDTRYSEVEGGKCTAGRSFASVVSNTSQQRSETDSTDESKSQVGFAEAETRSTRGGHAGDAPPCVGVKHITSNEETIGQCKQERGLQFANTRISYSSVVRNTNKCPETDICNTAASAFKFAQSDQQNLEPDLFWDSPWDCENYSSLVTDGSCSSYIGRENYGQGTTMSDSFSTPVPCDNGWDDCSWESECALSGGGNDKNGGHEPRLTSLCPRESETKSINVECMNTMPSVQEDISDQPTEWSSLWDEIELDSRHILGSPKAEIGKGNRNQVNHPCILITELHPPASHYDSYPGADSFAEAEYLTADSELSDPFKFEFSVDHIIPKLFQAVESLKVSQVVQGQKINFLERELAKSKEEVRELRERLNVIEISCSPELPVKKSRWGASQGNTGGR